MLNSEKEKILGERLRRNRKGKIILRPLSNWPCMGNEYLNWLSVIGIEGRGDGVVRETQSKE